MNSDFKILKTQEKVKITALTGRLLLRILGGGGPPGSPNPDPISEQKMTVIFHTRFHQSFILNRSE